MTPLPATNEGSLPDLLSLVSNVVHERRAGPVIPKINGLERSFARVAACCLHDAPEPEDRRLTTSERVGWIYTRHLAAIRAERAARLMGTMAKAASDLKRLAGMDAGGDASYEAGSALRDADLAGGEPRRGRELLSAGAGGPRGAHRRPASRRRYQRIAAEPLFHPLAPANTGAILFAQLPTRTEEP